MPGIAQRISSNASGDNNDTNTSSPNQLLENGALPFHPFNASRLSSNGFWSRHRDDVSYNQLQKFWCELTPQARQNLLRIDKQTLFEHARKNMYCSRCNGLLLEGFLQIVIYGKSLQQESGGDTFSMRSIDKQNGGELCFSSGCQEDAQDPSVHPWGGLTASRDGTLTLLDCYLYSKSLKGLQKVFDSARARERERELLYPDACGGGGRGWISQGVAGYSRGHGTRETCALHTAKLSVETLVDFWSALGEETRQSLLRMKEDDFIERLMYRFDSKRFCRDCRRNVIREFKELKELKRMRRGTRCTSWFCVADTTFQYEVTRDSVQADWHQTFSDSFGTYHHFEWAVGTGEGKSDILEFENVGLTVKVQVKGLDLSALNACYITLRAWKMDGRCNELSVKAHAVRGQQCVHCRLMIGDGFVTITRGDNITKFFEHAEEAEEEEDDDSIDKDGNELDTECSRPQKHAKSPELAREFLLDAATVIFKEQVEKAFREGTARQNAHSIFVCLALKLLEERVHIACKEIITLEKQRKLLEEEEKEKREDEERKERRRTKEREKKLRRKERLRVKEIGERKSSESNFDSMVGDVSKDLPIACSDEGVTVVKCGDFVSGTAEDIPSSSLTSDIRDYQLLTEHTYSNKENPSEDILDGELGNTRDWSIAFPYDHIKYSRRKPKFHKELLEAVNLKWSDKRKGATSENGIIDTKYESSRFHAGYEYTRCINGFNKILRSSVAKSNIRNDKLSEKARCTDSRVHGRYDSSSCSCNYHCDYSLMPESRVTEVVRGPKYVSRLEPPADVSKPYYRGNKHIQVDSMREIKSRPKSKTSPGTHLNAKKVWEPLDLQKKCIKSNSDSDVNFKFTPTRVEGSESDRQHESCSTSSDEVTVISVHADQEDNYVSDASRSRDENIRDVDNEINTKKKPQYCSQVTVAVDDALNSLRSCGTFDSSISNSSNCSSCPSDGDSNTFSNPQNLESRSTSDSEESSQLLEGRDHTSRSHEDGIDGTHDAVEDRRMSKGQDVKSHGTAACAITDSLGSLLKVAAKNCTNGGANVSASSRPLCALPQMHTQNINFPIFHPSPIGYYHQSPVSWSTAPTNGLLSFPHSNHYLFANSYEYCLNGNPGLMHSGAFRHVTPPLLNHTHMPMFQTASQVNGVCLNESGNAVHLGGPKEAQHGIQELISKDKHLVDVAGAVDDGQGGKVDKMDTGSNGFSLFHFGGPVGFKADAACLEEATVNSSDNCCEGDHPYNKIDSVGEYNLFAATNGIRFSIF